MKSADQITREFGVEKWGEILTRADREGNYSIEALERFDAVQDAPTPYFEDGQLLLASTSYSSARHLERLRRMLAPYASRATCLVELGAGYGAKLYRLARMPEFSSLPLVAAEFTQTGRELLVKGSSHVGRRVTVGSCDFFTLTSDVPIPPGALIFTMYSVHYVTELAPAFPDWLASYRPLAVVHCEPCLEHYVSGTLHDLLCAEYVRVNGYARNIASVLEAADLRRVIDIVVRQPKVIGGNPLLPASLIAWELPGAARDAAEGPAPADGP